MSRSSVLINVRCEVSIDVGWEVSVDGRVVSVDGGSGVSKVIARLIDLGFETNMKDYLLPDLRPQLSLVGLDKVSINTSYGLSIGTHFSPLIDATTELSIDVPSIKPYRTGLTCSLG
ncbi:hypothetical protein F2Q68_00015118 [Brassica cretica]|uniref:Uncharacterized protein n=1 Tax=Brassica cretica TaxID=69181 RepID=A0A8S9HWW7_BRACR|nr:hypothetical protein F2Q68_00015118 [Brassica cretica]